VYVERKLAVYLETGTRSVWLVNPRRRTVEVISSLNNRRMLHEDDELVDDTLPGFRVKVSEIFASPNAHLDRNLPIGIFDSGVGRLTVYKALHERLPNERFVYLGDTARVPYGTKSLATVERYTVENSRFLESHGIKLLVVACNTASALALPAIRAAIKVPVIGVIE